MFKKIRNCIEYLKQWFNAAMREPNVNSRFVFLLHGIVSALCVFTLTVAFVCAKNRDSYDRMVYAVSTSGGVASLGRYFTKKNSDTPAAPPSPDPATDADAPAQEEEKK